MPRARRQRTVSVAEATLDEGGSDDALRLLGRGLEVLDPGESADQVAAELRAYARVLGRLGRTSDLENALELARAVADPKGAAAAMAGTALGMITAGAVDRAVSIARELLAVEGDLADPAAACTSAAEVAAAAGVSDLVAEVVARAEVLDTPAVSATVAALLYQRGDQLSASRLLERAAARAREQSDEGDRALGFAQIAQALAPVRGEDARAAASAALSAVQRMKSWIFTACTSSAKSSPPSTP